MTTWRLSHRFDRRALPLADRHYNRQNVGSPQFVPPGSPVVLLTENADALWVSLKQKQEFMDHDWPGAWMNTLFRNESKILSSLLIRDAVAATLGIWGSPPPQGFVTFIDTTKVRHKRDPGRCYLKAGFKAVGYTKTNRLLVLQLLPEAMPESLFLPSSQTEMVL